MTSNYAIPSILATAVATTVNKALAHGGSVEHGPDTTA